jgi:hypothetical protein
LKNQAGIAGYGIPGEGYIEAGQGTNLSHISATIIPTANEELSRAVLCVGLNDGFAVVFLSM